MTRIKKNLPKVLLQTVLEKTEYLQSLIVPKLKNWDPERIAHLDMILMKMGVANFFILKPFPQRLPSTNTLTWPKTTAPQQSGQFVNGILDNIHKELIAAGKNAKSRL